MRVSYVKLQGISGLLFSTTWLLHVRWCHFVQSCATLCIRIQFAVMVLPCNLHILLKCAALDHFVQFWTTLHSLLLSFCSDTAMPVNISLRPVPSLWMRDVIFGTKWTFSDIIIRAPKGVGHQRGSTSMLPGEIL